MGFGQCCWAITLTCFLHLHLIRGQPDIELVSNKDNTFVIAFPAQPFGDVSGTNSLYLTADEEAYALMQIPSRKGAMDRFIRLRPGGTMRVDLPGSLRMPSITGLRAKNGINIFSNASISVYAVSMIQSSTDGYLALPMRFLLLGNEYLVVTYTPAMHAVVLVTAKHDATDVTFHLRLSGGGSVTVNGNAYKNGDKFKVVLNAFDSFQILADASAGSLTGTRIVSNKVVFVYSGNDCANVPSNTSSCDHLVEQMPPISSWGNVFLVKSTPYRQTGDVFHILASQNLTTVNIELRSGPFKVTINEGEVYEFNAAPGESYAIRCTKPCLVVQFGKSHEVDNNKNFAPFMSIVPSNDQWSDDVTLVVPSGFTKNFQCYANMIVQTKETKNIRSKSVTRISSIQWSAIPYTLYSTATVNLTSGQYRFYHRNPLKLFSVMFLCTAEYEAFGFPAGLRVIRRATNCINPKMIPVDRKDNDCDDRVDEELLNGIDDDNDGKIDEDLATPIPVMHLTPNLQLTECGLTPMSPQQLIQSLPKPPRYQVFGMCAIRGDIKTLKQDNFLNTNNCYSKRNRSWILTDGCLNTIMAHHIVDTYHIEPLKVEFPSNKTEEVYSCDNPSFGHKFRSGSPVIKSKCPGVNVTISHSDAGWEKLRQCSYSDYVVIKRTWFVFNSCQRVTGEQFIKIRKLGWPPSLTVSNDPVVSAANKNISIPCDVYDRVPVPDVMWILPDGKTLKTNESRTDMIEVLDDLTQRKKMKMVLPDHTLLITETRLGDSGLYTCFAVNDLGNATGVVNVTIHDDLVDVDASVTIKDLVFDPDLNKPFLDIEADEHILEMRKKIKQELTQVFINMTGFQEVKLLEFRNGSVKVLFRVVVKKQNKDEDPQVIVRKVGKKLSITVKSGQLGDYKIVPTMELREKPPPPTKLRANEVKESSVHITWLPPDLDSMYAISGYVLQYKVFGEKVWMNYDVVKGDNHVMQGLEEGTGYQIRTKSANNFGHSDPSESLEITTLDKGLTGAEIALIIIIPMVAIVICVLACYAYKKRRKRTSFGRSHDDHLLDNGIVRYSRPKDLIQIDEHHEWKELSRDKLELGLVLGEGEFGMVIEGQLTQDDGSILRCAVKKLKRTATESDMKDLLNELDIMVQVGSHPNIVNLIGACAYGGPIMVVVEYAANGSLLRYIQKQSSRRYEDLSEYQVNITPKQRLIIAGDVANGMAHLARQRCVHRDLAARNVLLDEKWTAKVSDFGLSRDVYTNSVYEKTTGGKLPAKWMAIEALEAGLNTTQSDVWSFGVLLWEIETGGCIPYPAFSAMEMLTALKQGYRLEKPMTCSIALYNIMLKCWEADPSSRPSFDDLYLELHELKEDIPGSLSYYENMNEDSYMETRA